MGEFFKDALVIEEIVLVGIDVNRHLFAGIIVIDQEEVIPVLFPDRVDISEIPAAFPTLVAFESQGITP